MLTLFYNFLLILLAFIAFPKMFYEFLRSGKYGNSFKKRLGKDFPHIDKNERPLVWIHAVSMGETQAIVSLAKTIKERHPKALLLISSITETGHAEAKKSIPYADYHVYLPFDISFLICPIIKQIKPDLVLLCENDLWLNFLKSCKANGATLAVINGKLSERSLSRLKRFPFFAKRLFAPIDMFCLQSNRYKERFLQAGVLPNKIEVTGNMKLDTHLSRLPTEEIISWKDKLKIEKETSLIVAGSTHAPEEKLLLEAFKQLWEKFPNLKLILVPRHPERFNEVASLLKSQNIPSVRYTQLDNVTGREKVILMDAMGLLRTCYQLADIAFVGGSLTTKVGGHNILEPSYYGKPVIFGPHMFKQVDLVEHIHEFKAGLQVPPQKLSETIKHLLESKETALAVGNAGLSLIASVEGATERTYNKISCFFAKNNRKGCVKRQSSCTI